MNTPATKGPSSLPPEKARLCVVKGCARIVLPGQRVHDGPCIDAGMKVMAHLRPGEKGS